MTGFYSWTIGLTGIAGSGKSTVAQSLKKQGCAVIDADNVAKLLTQPNQPALKQIHQHFGSSVFSDSKELNRSALAKIVFDQSIEGKARLKTLESILHPLMREYIIAERLKLSAHYPIILFDCAILFKVNLIDRLDSTISLLPPSNVCIERLTVKRGLSTQQATQIVYQQLQEIDFYKLSQFIIQEDLNEAETETRVKEIIQRITKIPINK